MNKKVSVTMRTVNDYGHSKDVTEGTFDGECYTKNDKLYIMFKDEFATNLIKIYENTVEVTRRNDSVKSQIVCEQDIENVSYYCMNEGRIELVTLAKRLEIIQEDTITVIAEYDLKMNGQWASKNELKIVVS